MTINLTIWIILSLNYYKNHKYSDIEIMLLQYFIVNLNWMNLIKKAWVVNLIFNLFDPIVNLFNPIVAATVNCLIFPLVMFVILFLLFMYSNHLIYSLLKKLVKCICWYHIMFLTGSIILSIWHFVWILLLWIMCPQDYH